MELFIDLFYKNNCLHNYSIHNRFRAASHFKSAHVFPTRYFHRPASAHLFSRLLGGLCGGVGL